MYKCESQRERKCRGKCFHTPGLRAVFLQVSDLALGRPAGSLVLSCFSLGVEVVCQLTPPDLHTFTLSVSTVALPSR